MQSRWPLLFILLIWFAFASPYFLTGKVPYASTYQGNFFPPWSHYEKFWGPVKNNAMPDVHGQIYPWKKFTIDTFRKGELPLWNPYSFSGNPHLANFQSAVLSPFNLLFFVFPFIDAWSILILVQPLLAGLFMYLFVRAIGVIRIGALISSVSFMFCGFMVVWMAYGTLGFAIVYLPLALLAVEKFFQTKKFLFLLLLVFTIPLSFFSGHFQISLYFLAGLVSYILFKGIVTKNAANALYLLLFTVFGLALSLPQLLPSIEFYKHAVRSEIFQISEAIPVQYLVTIIAPDFFGNPVTRNDWFGHYAEWAGFIGTIPLILAIYAVFAPNSPREKRQIIIFFAAMVIISLILAVNSPLSTFLISLKIPVLSTSALSRIIVLFSFSFAVLAGFGFESLQKDLRGNKSVKKIMLLFSAMSGVLIILWALLLFGKIYPDDWLTVAKRNLILPTVLIATSTVVVYFSVRIKIFAVLAIGLLLMAASFDSFRFAQKWMPLDPKELVYPHVPVIDGIARNIGQGRIFGNLGAEVTTYYGFPSIEGYDPLYIDRYGEFIRTASTGEFTKGERSVVKIDRNGVYTDRALDLLGVTLVFQPIADTNQGWAYPVWHDKKRYELIYKDDKFELYRNTLAMPRASLFYNFEVIVDSKDILTRFYSEKFDFRKTLLLEENPDVLLKTGTGSADIVQYTPNKITIHAQTTVPALLFLSDNFYPGWKVAVNGKEEKLYRANYSFRVVIVDSGESTVEFSYSPNLL